MSKKKKKSRKKGKSGKSPLIQNTKDKAIPTTQVPLVKEVGKKQKPIEAFSGFDDIQTDSSATGRHGDKNVNVINSRKDKVTPSFESTKIAKKDKAVEAFSGFDDIQTDCLSSTEHSRDKNVDTVNKSRRGKVIPTKVPSSKVRKKDKSGQAFSSDISTHKDSSRKRRNKDTNSNATRSRKEKVTPTRVLSSESAKISKKDKAVETFSGFDEIQTDCSTITERSRDKNVDTIKNRKGKAIATTKVSSSKVRKRDRSSQADTCKDSSRKRRKKDKNRDTSNTNNIQNSKKRGNDGSSKESNNSNETTFDQHSSTGGWYHINTFLSWKNKNGGSKEIGDQYEYVFDKYSNATSWQTNGLGEKIIPLQGAYSIEESNLIKEAIQTFCEKKGIPVDQFCTPGTSYQTKYSYQGWVGAWRRIATVLPNRTVKSIYDHALCIMHPYKRGPWTDEEVETLQKLVQKHGKKWASFRTELQRSAKQIRDKYRELGLGFKSGKWSKEEIDILIETARELSGVSNDVDLAQFAKMADAREIHIPWLDVSDMMNRKRVDCYKKFSRYIKKKYLKKKAPQLRGRHNFPKVLVSSISKDSWIAAQTT